MKILFRFLYSMFIVSMFILFTLSGYSDSPDPPPVPGGHGQGGTVAAPIDGGSGILLLLGMGYAAKKLFRIRKTRDKQQQ
jgi:hypothetical protein